MTTHIIVPTCAPQPILRDMLASLAEHTKPCHLVLVVNHGDGWRHPAALSQVECLRDNGWRVTLADEGQPIGYVGACNLGWRVLDAARNDYVAVLNDDIIIQGQWAEPLIQALDAGAKLVGPSLKTIGPDGCWGGPSDPPYIEGWCLMMQFPHAFPAGWLFDPQFAPQLCEDMDLGLRMQYVHPGTIRQVDIPIQHTRHATCDPATQPENARVWEENRRKLIARWNLGHGAPPVQSIAQGQSLTDGTTSFIHPVLTTSFVGVSRDISAEPEAVPPNPATLLSSRAAQKNWQVVP